MRERHSAKHPQTAARILRQYHRNATNAKVSRTIRADWFNAKFNADILKRHSVLATAFVFGMIAIGK